MIYIQQNTGAIFAAGITLLCVHLSWCPCVRLSWCTPDDSDAYREEVRRLKVDLEAARTIHAQELKAKNDYVREPSQLARGEGVGVRMCFTVLFPILRLSTWRECLQNSER